MQNIFTRSALIAVIGLLTRYFADAKPKGAVAKHTYFPRPIFKQ